MEHKWDSSLEVGYEPIDNQHKQLFEAICELIDNFEGDHTGDQLRKSMDFLNNYTIKHFFDEEQIQQKYKYPDFPNHKKLHDGFKEVVKEFSHRLILEGASKELAEEVRKKIYDWLINHIKIQDKKLGIHLKSTGITG
ncbi:MAG: hemerythrin family protein [Treponema sp.]|nr:hemerythrin family protein [Treponema sp.]